VIHDRDAQVGSGGRTSLQTPSEISSPAISRS